MAAHEETEKCLEEPKEQDYFFIENKAAARQ